MAMPWGRARRILTRSSSAFAPASGTGTCQTGLQVLNQVASPVILEEPLVANFLCSNPRFSCQLADEVRTQVLALEAASSQRRASHAGRNPATCWDLHPSRASTILMTCQPPSDTSKEKNLSKLNLPVSSSRPPDRILSYYCVTRGRKLLQSSATSLGMRLARAVRKVPDYPSLTRWQTLPFFSCELQLRVAKSARAPWMGTFRSFMSCVAKSARRCLHHRSMRLLKAYS